jgi:phosphoribosylformimino-5-aminoimidazole carboxamide ribonucleotide (ProFAR) isomerase
MFEVIPAIDVAAGRLARIAGAGTEPLAAYGGDPVGAAEAFTAAGARWLHVVDLDLARAGRAENLDVVRRVAALGVPVQASGGVRTAEHVEAFLEAGASRVVVGSAALAEPGRVGDLLARYGERLVVAIEADGATIRPRGGGAELPLWDTLGWLAELPVPRFLYVEVGRVGRMEGPDLDGIWALARHTGRPVLASGGIRDLEDLRAIASLGGHVEGAVVGRALLEGGLSLADALAAVGSDPPPPRPA